MTSRECIDDFLAQKRIAFVGVSRSPGDFSRALFRELRDRDYEVIPVNPNAAELEGGKCYGRVQDIDPAPDGVLVMIPKSQVMGVVNDCIDAGVQRLWLHGINGPNEDHTDMLAACRDHGIRVVSGYCLYMFLSDVNWLHRFHVWIMKAIKQYPV